MSEWLATYRDWLETHGRSRNTIAAYVSDVRQFLNWATEHEASLAPTDIDRNIARWLREPAANATIARRMASLRLFCKVVYGIEVLDDHPTPRPVRAYAHPLPDGVDDLRRMLEVADYKHRPLIALCGYAGARITEARMVQATDFDTDDDGVTWVLLRGKGKADRRVPLPDEAIEHLHLDAIKVGRLVMMSDRGARYAITRAAKKAGVTRAVASHDLRMTFGTAVYDQTLNLRVTQELLGHQSSATTERYTGVRETALTKAVKETFAS